MEGECLSAFTALLQARNRIIALCNILNQLQTKLTNLNLRISVVTAAIISSMAIITAWGISGAMFIPWVGPIVMAILASVWLTLSAILFILTRQSWRIEEAIESTIALIREAQEDFNNAVLGILENCPRDAFTLEDITMPRCN